MQVPSIGVGVQIGFVSLEDLQAGVALFDCFGFSSTDKTTIIMWRVKRKVGREKESWNLFPTGPDCLAIELALKK